GVQDILRRRAERRARGREIFGAFDRALDGALDLGLDPLRDRCQIEARGRAHFCAPDEGDAGGRLVRGGRGALAWPDDEPPAFLCCSIALISLSWFSMLCSRSAMPIICARLGRFMLRRYFSMSSP